MSDTALRVVRGACPHDCPDTCAMLVHVDAAGRAVRVSGDPDHPITDGFLCGKVAHYVERVYAEDRLLHPLIRTGPKGEGRFRRATWDEALATAAAGLRGAIDRHGGESVLPYSYAGTMGLLQYDAMSGRFMDAIGASRLARNICATAGVIGVQAVQGHSPEVDPELWAETRLFVLWGWNPAATAPHLWKLILGARANGARIVVVDPYRSRTARVADQHLQPIPGTDAAMALGLMRAMVDAGVHDEDWCRAHSLGYDELLERLAERTVEDCAALCGLPAATLRELGETFARTQPSLLRLGVGAQRHYGAPEACAALACVPALAGSWRHRGGGFAYVPMGSRLMVDASALDRPELRARRTREIPMASLGEVLTDRTLAPPVAALVVWNSNPAGVAPDQTQVLAGLAREDLFTIAIEQFLTDTAAHADVVLPATTQLEHEDVVRSWGHHVVAHNHAAIAPQGEALPNTEIFRRLARHMGLDHPCFGESDAEMLEQIFARTPGGLTLAGLRTQGWGRVAHGRGETPHAAGGFATPSGKFEFRSNVLEQAGFDPLPRYEPPAEIADLALAARFPLVLITPKTALFLNTSFATQPRLAQQQPEPYVVLHPQDAGARGVAEGDTVRIWNDRGAFTARARVNDDTAAGVAVAPFGWWTRSFAGGGTAQATTSQRLTTRGAAPTFYDNRVEVERAIR